MQRNIGDTYNDTADICPRNETLSNKPLYFWFLKNYDGANNRKSSDIVVNSVDNNTTGSINTTNQLGFLDITRGRLKIDDQLSQIL